MKRLCVTASCEATVTESWVFNVPDDYVIDDDADLNDLLNDEELVEVTNDVIDNEREREIIGYELRELT